MSNIPANLDEQDINAAGKYILKHGSGNDGPPKDFIWYLKALRDEVALQGFWMIDDDYELRKHYLDDLVVSSEGLFGKYSSY